MQNIYLPRTAIKEKYIRKLDEDTKNDIRTFYLEGGITISLPQAQYANTLFLNRSLKEACEMFNNTRGSKRKVGLSAFSRQTKKG